MREIFSILFFLKDTNKIKNIYNNNNSKNADRRSNMFLLVIYYI